MTRPTTLQSADLRKIAKRLKIDQERLRVIHNDIGLPLPLVRALESMRIAEVMILDIA